MCVYIVFTPTSGSRSSCVRGVCFLSNATATSLPGPEGPSHIVCVHREVRNTKNVFRIFVFSRTWNSTVRRTDPPADPQNQESFRFTHLPPPVPPPRALRVGERHKAQRTKASSFRRTRRYMCGVSIPDPQLCSDHPAPPPRAPWNTGWRIHAFRHSCFQAFMLSDSGEGVDVRHSTPHLPPQ